MRSRYAAPLRAMDGLRVTTCRGDLLVSAWKVIVADDPYLPGHFPDQPIYPGVFIVETVRQAVTTALGEPAGAVPRLAAVRSVRFLAPLRPGDELRVEATVRTAGVRPDTGVAIGSEARCCRTDGTEVARLTLEFRYPERRRDA